MQKFSTKKILITLVVTLLSTFPFSSKVVFASEIDGTTDATNKYAWADLTAGGSGLWSENGSNIYYVGN